jgi:hypothetical protein
MDLSILKKTPNKREKIMFFIFIFLFCLVFIKKYVYPSYFTLFDLNSKINALNKTTSHKIYKTYVKKNNEEFLYYQKKAVFTHLLDNNELILYISGENIKKSIGITDMKIEEENIGDIHIKKISYKAYGPFLKIGEYLSRLENLPLFLIFDSIKINIGADKFFRISMDISGKIYGIDENIVKK